VRRNEQDFAATLTPFDRNGALMAQAVPLVPGAVKLSIIVRDTASGLAGSLSLPLDRLQAK